MFEHNIASRDAMIAAAQSAIRAGEFDRAEGLLKSLLHADPNDAEAASLLASAVARNVSAVRQTVAVPRRIPVLIGSPNSFWNRQYKLSQPLLCWLYAFGFFLIGFIQLFRSLPLMLAQGPDAAYTYTTKGGYLASEPVSYAVAEGGVMIFVAVTCAAAALWMRRR